MPKPACAHAHFFLVRAEVVRFFYFLVTAVSPLFKSCNFHLMSAQTVTGFLFYRHPYLGMRTYPMPNFLKAAISGT